MDGIPDEIQAHYAAGVEAERLAGPRLERLRTEELLTRHLPSPPARILDVGGGPGRYSAWLANLGYEVELIDPVPLHIEQATALARDLERPFKAAVGDARSLAAQDDTFDATLVMGPLYHLTERDDRMQALREASRVTKPGGLVVGAAVSRFASLVDGLAHGFLGDERFLAVVQQDVATGQHRNPTDDLDWFTTAYFHRPAELESEFRDAGFVDVELVGVEGPGSGIPGVDVEQALVAARLVECDRDLLAASSHLLAFGRRQP